MTQPTQTPDWNTSGSNRVDPPSGQKSSGWTVNQAPPSSYFNWWMNLVYQWVLYLKNLTLEALVWVELQSFQKGLTASQSVANTNTVTITTNGTGTGVSINASTNAASRALKAFTGAVNGVAIEGVASHLGSAGLKGTATAGSASGVLATASGAGGYAVTASGTGFGVGSGSGALNATNAHNVPDDVPCASFYNESVGDVVKITAEGGKALQVFGGESNHAALIVGNSAGLSGLKVTSSAPGQPAAIFEGTTGGTGASGSAIQAQGGSPTSGLGEPALVATGGAGVAAIVATGGAGFAPGAVLIGGPSGGAGVSAVNQLGSWAPAVQAYGTIDLTNQTFAALGAQVVNQVTKYSIAKSIGLIALNGTATPTLVWGQHAFSLAQDVAGLITIVFPTGFASADFGAEAIYNGGYNTTDASFAARLIPLSKTASQVVFGVFSATGTAAINRTDSQLMKILFKVWGPQ